MQLSAIDSAASVREVAPVQLAQVPPEDRPSLDTVLRDYQVSDDTTALWSPKVFGAIPIPFQESRELTTSEGRLLDRLTFDRGLAGLNEFRNIRDEAFEVSANRFAGGAEDGHQDAFRHAYWSARLTQEFGANWAEQFTTAHEALPGNPSVREAMDLYNNEVGRRIAVENPRASAEELANLIEAAINNGEMLVVDARGNLAWSDQVAEGQTGRADAAPALPGRIAVPDGTASAH
jgi:hypothetical protein